MMIIEEGPKQILKRVRSAIPLDRGCRLGEVGESRLSIGIRERGQDQTYTYRRCRVAQSATYLFLPHAGPSTRMHRVERLDQEHMPRRFARVAAAVVVPETGDH
jgi:hypothetical protein